MRQVKIPIRCCKHMCVIIVLNQLTPKRWGELNHNNVPRIRSSSAAPKNIFTVSPLKREERFYKFAFHLRFRAFVLVINFFVFLVKSVISESGPSIYWIKNIQALFLMRTPYFRKTAARLSISEIPKSLW